LSHFKSIDLMMISLAACMIPFPLRVLGNGKPLGVAARANVSRFPAASSETNKRGNKAHKKPASFLVAPFRLGADRVQD
jgi:hypothetical protein